jgi:VWFA-related protein
LISTLCVLAAGTSATTLAQQEAPPIEVDKVETARVRLIMLDVVVLDSEGRTVPGLTLEDFEIVAGGRAVDADTLDVDCTDALDDPGSVRHAKTREMPAPTEQGRKIVMALDYMHLDMLQRAEALDYAMEAVKVSAPGDQILLAALNGGLRIEQPFTADHDEAWRGLRRMQRDITLWQPSFEHSSEIGWIRAVTTLFDVLETVPGPKAVVLFSGMGDVPLDLEFQEIAAHAAAARCSVYPVDVRGITTLNGGGGTAAAPG